MSMYHGGVSPRRLLWMFEYEAVPLPPILSDPENFSGSIDLFVHSRGDSAPPLHLNRVFYLDARNLVNGHVCETAIVEARHGGRHTNIQNLIRVNVDDEILIYIVNMLMNIFEADSADEDLEQSPQLWGLVVFCDAGRHRSLGWALFLALLLQALGFKVRLWAGLPRFEHEWHPSRLCSVRNCLNCSTDHPLPPWLIAAWANRILELILERVPSNCSCSRGCEDFITFIDHEFACRRIMRVIV